MLKIKIYDCSLNDTAPKHRLISKGPKENYIMADLKKYSTYYGFEYINDWKDADVIITNTTFPDKIKNSNIFKVKRMDGIFWRDEEVHRNKKLNESAIIADLVIFISEFSKKSFHTLYPELDLKNETVILNGVDDTVFYNTNLNPEYKWLANCSNWIREEKRFLDICAFAGYVDDDVYLIGECDFPFLPNNIKCLGYISDYDELRNHINKCENFINLSFRDAGCKCVSQAIACEKPILYANSGGVPELVKKQGESIFDKYSKPSFLTETPELNMDDIINGLERFEKNKSKFNINKRNYQNDVIKKYFDEINKNKNKII